MNPYRVTAALVAFTFVFAAPLLYAAGFRPVAFENRPLATAPNHDDGWNFFAELAPWANDHLPARKHAVQANAWIDYYLLGSLPRTASGAVGAAGAGGNDASGPGSRASAVVQGRNGYLLFRRALDAACSTHLEANMHKIARVADVIRASGRRVVFTVGPDKASVVGDSLPELLPGPPCVGSGLVRQRRILDDFDAPGWLPLRADLQRAHDNGDQVYWKTDTHWNSVGAALFATAIAQQLDPDVATTLELTDTVVRRRGDLFEMVGLPFAEQAPGVVLGTGGEVAEVGDSSRFDPDRDVYPMNKWRTGPAGTRIQGRSLLIGDSFTYYALDVLRPLFAEGTFFWTGKSGPTSSLLDQIEAADTVVIESVQRQVADPGGVLESEKFRKLLAQRLGAPRR